MNPSAPRVLDWSVNGRVLEAALRRSPCNEIGWELVKALEGLMEGIEGGAFGDIRAVVLYSAIERGFSAGADLRALHQALQQHTQEQAMASAREFIERIHRVFNRLDALPMPTIAALSGCCFGGGFELALLADIRVADGSTRFAFPELRLGLMPGFGGMPRLRREVGQSACNELLLSGRSWGAKRAHELGLVQHLVARGQALDAARRLAAHLTAHDAEVVALAKRFIKGVPKEELARERELFLQLLGHERVRQALADFVSRSDAMPYLAR